jgi:hypothetical protein
MCYELCLGSKKGAEALYISRSSGEVCLYPYYILRTKGFQPLVLRIYYYILRTKGFQPLVLRIYHYIPRTKGFQPLVLRIYYYILRTKGFQPPQPRNLNISRLINRPFD